MQLEDYFEFEKFETKFGIAERIRLKGHRIAIESIVEEFSKGATPDQIQKSLPTLTLEEVYAAITYYLHNKDEVDAYIQRGKVIEDAFYQEHLQREPDEVTKRLRALVAQRKASGPTTDG